MSLTCNENCEGRLPVVVVVAAGIVVKEEWPVSGRGRSHDHPIVVPFPTSTLIEDPRALALRKVP